jgi:cell division protein FtsZ
MEPTLRRILPAVTAATILLISAFTHIAVAQSDQQPTHAELAQHWAEAAIDTQLKGMKTSLYEVDEAAGRIRQEVDDEANIILGATFEPALEGAVRVSVVATGIDQAANLQIDGMSARNLTQKVVPFPRVA